eukprot:GHVH01007232.1.p1 GENE.GHVH01007232.1~~GHVH01007232.1.p1  ORF type:complete len:1145 (+),score=175.51 GHVH01007232.1:231-3665(+)
MSTFGDDGYERIQDLLAEHERWLGIVYVLGALCFSIAIFNFRKPSTSQMGNIFAIVGMATSLAGTLASTFVNGYGYWIFTGCFLSVGGIGIFMAVKVKMTNMPVFVGFLNAMGGLAAALESLALYVSPIDEEQQNMEWELDWGDGGKKFQIYYTIFYLLGMIIGTITFSGSIVACLKLQGKFKFTTPRGKKINRILLKGRSLFTFILVAAFIATGFVAGFWGLGVDPVGLTTFAVSMFLSGLYGIYFVLCIGGADMPVVISLLNSLSGWSTMFAGLAFGNELMIIAGSFVGASGLILSVLMCQAMNRSLKNVLVGGFGGDSAVEEDRAKLDAVVVDVETVAKYICSANLVYVVPGYGMAVSQAQKQVAELGEIINASGRECRFAVHPVAGRLPGHMNVLLAEANVPYNYVDDITANGKLDETDVVLVVGANDIYNPAAKFDKGSNIYGMEVLEVWNAKRTVVVKRSMRTGYAGIDNALFYYPQNSMLLGDAKEVIRSLADAVKHELAHGSEDARDAYMSGDCQRIAVRVEDEKRLALAHANAVDDEDDEDDGPLHPSPMPVTVGFLREPKELNDRRIPLTPKDAIELMSKPWGIKKVLLQKGGDNDAMFADAGVLVCSRNEILTQSDIILSMTIPNHADLDMVASHKMGGSSEIQDRAVFANLMVDGREVATEYRTRNIKPVVISVFGNPSGTSEAQEHARNLGISVLSMDIMPRVTTAQCMDVLSSSAKIAGFRAVIEACNHYGRLIGAEITAAGSYRPAKCLVVGCGVAGLQAVGDAHRLGAEVRAFDVRKECADQVKSMGGKFLLMDFGDEDGAGAGGYANIMSPEFIEKEMALLHEQAKECDLYILTASIPGRKAPILLKSYHVASMKPGSVVVDLAAPSGGNCESTRPGENYTTDNGVIMIGCVDFVKTVSAPISSDMLSANLMNWFDYNVKSAGTLNVVDVRDKIIRAIVLTHQGSKLWPAPRPPAPAPAVVIEDESEVDVVEVKQSWLSRRNTKFFNSSPADWIVLLFFFGFFALLGWSAPVSLNSKLMILMLSCWTGYLLVRGVTVALHTPLMSLTNAISGVVIVAAMLSVSPLLAAGTSYSDNLCDDPSEANMFYCEERSIATVIIDSIALAAASINVVGGFAVTQRMLQMFKSK